MTTKTSETSTEHHHVYNINKLFSLNPIKQKLYLMGKYSSNKLVKHNPIEKKGKKVYSK